MTSLFVSDTHLTPDDPATVTHFLNWLTEVAADADVVYILGDLFEAWPGDDYLTEAFPATVVAALGRLSAGGIRVYLLHGNRDFLLGSDFCQATHATLLTDPSLIALPDQPTLVLHGDILCTDDHDYQRVRRQVRDPAWQTAVLAQPLEARKAMARQVLTESAMAKEHKSGHIMDVNANAVSEAFRGHGCRRMIHGHTHRPARHVTLVDGQECERWVLPDWQAGHGGYLRCDASGCKLIDY